MLKRGKVVRDLLHTACKSYIAAGVVRAKVTRLTRYLYPIDELPYTKIQISATLLQENFVFVLFQIFISGAQAGVP